MKIAIDAQSIIESIRNVLAGLYSRQFETAISVAEALLIQVSTEARRQHPLFAICPSVEGSGCDRGINCEECPAFDLVQVRLVAHRKLAAKLNHELSTDDQEMCVNLKYIDDVHRKIQKQFTES